jgi:anti-sigma factor RsiW
MPACARPVSWLALERHALGELDRAGADELARHLDGCAACRAAYAVIEADRERALPPLPDVALAAAARRRRTRRVVVATGLAAVAALLLVWREREPTPRFAGIRGGGDDLEMSLVRERDGDIAHDPSGFRPGDRFKVLVTCAAAAPITVELIVHQAGDDLRPLAPVELSCGNRVPVPGAIRITGREPVSICVAAGDAIECRDLAAE